MIPSVSACKTCQYPQGQKFFFLCLHNVLCDSLCKSVLNTVSFYKGFYINDPSCFRTQNYRSSVQLKFFWGVMTSSRTPPPYEQLLPLPTPYFKMFLEIFLNDSHPHHPTSSIFHCYPLPIHHTCPPPP